MVVVAAAAAVEDEQQTCLVAAAGEVALDILGEVLEADIQGALGEEQERDQAVSEQTDQVEHDQVEHGLEVHGLGLRGLDSLAAVHTAAGASEPL